jgi:hypothetical protein
MRIVVITSCTGEKAVEDERALRQSDFERGAPHLAVREQELAHLLTPAETLYSGQQHARLMRGVQAFRAAPPSTETTLDLWILSAGYGFVPGERHLAPYECTFQGMKKAELERWAEHLGVPQAIRRLLAEPYDLVLLLLGDSYLAACGLDETVVLGGPTLALCGSVMAGQLPALDGLRTVVLTNQEAKRFSCGLVGLKGELGARLLRLLRTDPEGLERLLDPEQDVLTLLEDQPSEREAKVPRQTAAPRPEVDRVIQLPSSWREKPHRERLRYFIPEWDDLVDPDYDFEHDEHASGTGDWTNEVYAHQLYPEPNYDGILISKVVAERSVKKRERINQMGVHRYLRVPRDFPIMGDCGAFGYINEEVPPYTTDEILDYYTRLGFDYGVSLDHLIVAATEQQKRFRYELTIHNAERFLQEHRARGLPWEPIGAVQGWDTQSYAEAARQYVAMGYRYLALGGLVRTSTRDILAILEAVHPVVPDTVALHLFGIARAESIARFAALGVRSVDSASALRRAWLGSADNYWTLEGTVYAAIRIPEAGKSFRAKRIVTEGRGEAAQVARLERTCLDALRAFDQGTGTVEGTLEILDEYDQLVTPERKSMRDVYRLTLEARPWQRCPCEICRRDGVEVAIFRGNNRNRRRGFHNTYVFYRLLQQSLAGAPVPMVRPGSRVDSRQLSLFPVG